MEGRLKNVISGIFYRKYRIGFTFNGKPTSTVFEIHRVENGIVIENKCISIQFKKNVDNMYRFTSTLKKDDESKKCFDPPLDVRRHGNANVNSKKHTMTDALQVLATKIKLSMPDVEKLPITIGDVASIDGVSLSPFRIMRGQDTLYEKYGYGSEPLKRMKAYVKTLKWGELLAIGDVRNIIHYFTTKFDGLKEALDVDSSVAVTAVFSRITMKDEKDTLRNKYDAPLSHIIYDKIEEELFGENNEDDPLVLQLNENSKEWKKMSEILTIVSVEEVLVGGGRKTRKRKNLKKNRRTIG